MWGAVARYLVIPAIGYAVSSCTNHDEEEPFDPLTGESLNGTKGNGHSWWAERDQIEGLSSAVDIIEQKLLRHPAPRQTVAESEAARAILAGKSEMFVDLNFTQMLIVSPEDREGERHYFFARLEESSEAHELDTETVGSGARTYERGKGRNAITFKLVRNRCSKESPFCSYTVSMSTGEGIPLLRLDSEDVLRVSTLMSYIGLDAPEHVHPNPIS